MPRSESFVSSPRQYAEEMSAFLNDKFGGRAFLISLYNRLKTRIDRSNSQMVRGTSRQWMYYDFPRAWEQYAGRKPLSEKDATRWNEVIAEFRQMSADKDAIFLATYAPNKNRIYPEYVPARYGSLSISSSVDELDWDLTLVKLLGNAKANSPMYFQTDTHWTNEAGFLVYRRLMDEVNRRGANYPVLERQKLSIRDMSSFVGDLVKLGGLTPENFVEPHKDAKAPQTNTQKSSIAFPSPSGNPRFQTMIRKSTSGVDSTLVIIGDSFAKPLLQFFDHSFDQVVFIHNEVGAFQFEQAFNYNPDVIILLPVERFAEQLVTYPEPLY